jgi:hypothetical protein
MLAIVAYAAIAETAAAPLPPALPSPPPPAPPSSGEATGSGQPIGKAVLTSPPTHGGKVVDVAIAGVTGVTATVTAARGGDADQRLGSLSLSTRRIGYAYDRGLVVRVSNAGELGGNDRGLHGLALLEVAAGYRFHVADTHGPFVRGGAGGRLSGDALVYQSTVEVPEVQAGYQYATGSTLLELTSRAGFSVFGRSDTGVHATRHLDESPDVGAMATVRSPHTLLLVTWSHFLPTNHGGGIDWVDAGLCATFRRLALCTDVRLVAGDVNLANGTRASSSVTQVGVTAGMAGK